MTHLDNLHSHKLRELDAALAEQSISDAAERKLRALVSEQRLRKQGRSQRLIWRVGVASATIAAVVVFVGHTWFRRLPHSAPDELLRCHHPSCVYEDAAMGAKLTYTQSTQVVRDGQALRLVSGIVYCDVAARKPRQAPFRLYVSAGYIEVIGTSFWVGQSADAGEVHLQHGVINFHDRHGAITRLNAGQQHRWTTTVPPIHHPRENEGPETKQGLRPSATKRTAKLTTRNNVTLRNPQDVRVRGNDLSQTSAESILEEVERLRAQSRYEAARDLLDKHLAKLPHAANTEPLSYELGLILSDHIKQQPAACRHWKTHMARYPGGRYVEEVAQIQRRLQCN